MNRVSRRSFLKAVSLCAAASLTGCGASAPAAEAPAQEYPVLSILTAGASNDAACARISELLSALTEPEYGFSVSISQATTEAYYDTLIRRFMTGTAPDLFCYMDAEYLLHYVQSGYTAALDELLPDYPFLHGSQSSIAEEVWRQCEVNGSTFAVPCSNAVNYYIGFYARKDLLEQLGEDDTEIADWDDLHELLLRVHKQLPDIPPLVPDSGLLLPSIGEDPLGNDLGVLEENRGKTVTDLYSSAAYADICRRMRTWYQEGLILPDAYMTTASAAELLTLYNGFGFFARLNSDELDMQCRQYNGSLHAWPLTRLLANSSSLNYAWCISSSTQLKTQALQFIEFLYIDQEAADTYLYGEEAADYTRVSESVVTAGPLTGLADCWQPELHTCVNHKKVSSWQTEIDSEAYLPQEGASRSPAFGFVFDSSAVESEVSSCTAIQNKYVPALLCGYLDPEEALSRFKTELEEAGLDIIIKEKQDQLDLWLAAR